MPLLNDYKSDLCSSEKKRVEVKCSGYVGTIKRNFVEEEDTRRSIKGNGFVQAEKS